MTAAKPHRRLYHPEDDEHPVSPALFWVLFGSLLTLTALALSIAAAAHLAR